MYIVIGSPGQIEPSNGVSCLATLITDGKAISKDCEFPRVCRDTRKKKDDCGDTQLVGESHK